MRKELIGIVMMLLCIVGVSAATYHIGDTVKFETSITPSCGESHCLGLPGAGCEADCAEETTEEGCLESPYNAGCLWDGEFCLPDKDTCLNGLNEGMCYWDDESLSCDLDLSDNEGLLLYGGYALKGPDGEIKLQSNPTEQCGATYDASVEYAVDELGVWKFCSKMYALDVSYANQECSNELLDCEMKQCVEVEVVDECHSDAAVVEDTFLNWLNSW